MQGFHLITQISWESSSSDERESIVNKIFDETYTQSVKYVVCRF